ncbi:MAG: hypothetical protein IPQ01_14650 [Zoogloea sp.]|nr:hypothetical protein [Zoogloea sp.]
MGIAAWSTPDEGSTGSLSTHDDVLTYFFHAANTFDLIFSLVEMGEDAQHTLNMRSEAVRSNTQEVQS